MAETKTNAMKRVIVILVWMFFAIATTVSLYATCPQTNCDNDCGSSGSGCQITQYDENGNLCSTTQCHGKRGLVL